MRKALTYTTGELAEKLKQKDKAAFIQLYDNYSKSLLGLITTIVKDDELAEDILQDVFVKIWRNIDSYNREKGTLFTWMLNIARNTSIDTLRSKVKKHEVLSLENNLELVGGMHNTSLNTDTLGVKKIVDTLKPEYKEIIDLVYFSGFTQEEISKKINIPLGTVKTRVRSALIELRKAFV